MFRCETWGLCEQAACGKGSTRPKRTCAHLIRAPLCTASGRCMKPPCAKSNHMGALGWSSQRQGWQTDGRRPKGPRGSPALALHSFAFGRGFLPNCSCRQWRAVGISVLPSGAIRRSNGKGEPASKKAEQRLGHECVQACEEFTIGLLSVR